jgi:transcriptional antiterminator NusG
MAEVSQANEQASASTASVFAVKTTANQERSVANLIAMVARKENFDIRSILVPEELKGYVLVESPMHEIVEHAIQNIPHAKAVVKGASSIAEVQHFLAPKPVVTGISEGDIVELISGPFKGERARVKRVDETKEEITVELSEAMVPIPVTVRGDIVRVLSKEEAKS